MDNDWGGGKTNRLVFAIFDEECERLEVFLFGHRLSHLAPLMIASKQTPLGFWIDWVRLGGGTEDRVDIWAKSSASGPKVIGAVKGSNEIAVPAIE